MYNIISIITLDGKPHEESYLDIIYDILVYFDYMVLYQVPQIIFIAITLPRDFTQYFIKFLCVYTIVSFTIYLYWCCSLFFLFSVTDFQIDFLIVCGLY